MNKFITITFLLVFVIACFVAANTSCERERKIATQFEKVQIELTEAQSTIKRLTNEKGDKVAQVEVLQGDIRLYKAALYNQKEYTDDLESRLKSLQSKVDENTVTLTDIETILVIRDTVETETVKTKYEKSYPTYQAIFGKADSFYLAKVQLGQDSSFLDLSVYNKPTLEHSWLRVRTSENPLLFFLKEDVLMAEYSDKNPYMTTTSMLSYVSLPEIGYYHKWNFGLFMEMNGQAAQWGDLTQQTAYQDVFGAFVNRSVGNARIETTIGKSFLQNTWVGSVHFRVSTFKD